MPTHHALRQLSDGAPGVPAAGRPAGALAAAAAAAGPSKALSAAAGPSKALSSATGPSGALPTSAVSAASLWRELKARLLGGRDAQNRPPGSMRSHAIAQFSQKIHFLTQQNQSQYQRVRDSSLFYSSKK